MLDEDLSQEQEIDFCTGCFFVIRTQVLRQVGGFDRRYFMYVEDADLTRKVLAQGESGLLAGSNGDPCMAPQSQKEIVQFPPAAVVNVNLFQEMGPALGIFNLRKRL